MESVLQEESTKTFVQTSKTLLTDYVVEAVSKSLIACYYWDDVQATVGVVYYCPRTLKTQAMENGLEWEEQRVCEQVTSKCSNQLWIVRLIQCPLQTVIIIFILSEKIKYAPLH